MQSEITFPLFGHTIVFSSMTLLAVGALLLIAAGVLLAFASKRRVALQRSIVTDELMVHLARITEALEHQAARPMEKVVAEALTQVEAERSAPLQPSSEAHTIPYSMFGREFQQSR